MACLLRTSATPGPGWRYRQGGFTLIEMTVTLVVLGLLVAMTVPTYLSYRQSAILKSGAQQVVTMINVARELALRINDNVCVKIPSPTTMTYTLGGCSGSVWVGAGTDAAGNMALPEGVTVSTTANPVFNYVGSALPAATYTVTNTQTSATLTVSVALSGRVTIP
ncbi:MAG TPA: prepilin-type N-terminal cleavage/methylation domain-containing protein [Methylomirabilota bacterium]|nr:prepilin-type N-terminal cleavage/methylation domain-containing protein [Methylomirabilota bacterium]